MAPFAPNVTNRYRVKYVSNGLVHTMLWRTGEESPAAVLDTGMLDRLITPIDTLIPSDFAILDCTESEMGSDIFVPSTVVQELTTASPSGTLDDAFGPNFFTFGGASDDGRLYDFQLFGISIQPNAVPGDDYRYSPGDSAAVDLAVGVLKTDAAWTQLTTISLRSIRWRSYVNFGVSAYWQRAIRG